MGNLDIALFVESKTRKEQIKYLLSRKFPYILFKSDGQITWDCNGEYKEQQEALCALQIAEFKKLQDDELLKLYNQERQQQRTEMLEKEAFEESQRFFNHSSAAANFEYFSKFDTLSIEEHVALIMGKDPRIVSFDKVQKYMNTQSKFVKKYCELLELTKRKFRSKISNPLYSAFDASTHGVKTMVSVPEYINWIFENQIATIPPEYVLFLQERLKTKLTIQDLKSEVNNLQEQLKNITSPLEGIRLNEIRNVECLTTSLQSMLLASQNFWVAFKNKALGEEPKEEDIVQWLVERGISRTLAKHAATLIRPTWASKGRRSDK